MNVEVGGAADIQKQILILHGIRQHNVYNVDKYYSVLYASLLIAFSALILKVKVLSKDFTEALKKSVTSVRHFLGEQKYFFK